MFERIIESAVEKALDRRIGQMEGLLETEVQKALDRRTIQPEINLTLNEYNPLPDIIRHLYSWVFIPFKGKEILVEVRYLHSTQLPDVKKLSFLLEEQKKNTELTHEQMIEIMNIQEECCRAVLNRPTFEEFEYAIYGKKNIHENRRKKLEELRMQINASSGQEKQEYQIKFDRLELFIGSILPTDTMLALTNIALDIDISEIKKITNKRLVTASSKAKLYNGKPSDYISGIFTNDDKIFIDDYAIMLYNDEEAKK